MMKLIKSLLLITLTTGTTHLISYEFFCNNFTNKILIIAFKKRAGIKERFYQIVGPGKSVLQPWADANCLESMEWAELNPTLPLRGGLDLVDRNRGGQIPPDKQQLFDETFFNKKTGKGLYLWNNLKIVMLPNEIFEETVKQATKLVAGFDRMVCQSIDWLLLDTKDSAFKALRSQLTTAENKLAQAQKTGSSAGTISSLSSSVDQLKDKVKAYADKLMSQSTNQDDCFFNLARIAQAAGKIHGISLCKSRQFVIFNTGEKDPLTGMPLFLAETTEGE